MYADSLSITADGKQLVVLRGNLQGDVYVAEAEAGGKSYEEPTSAHPDDRYHAIGGWTPDSRAVLFSSSRSRNNADIFKQDLTQADAEAIVATPENEWHPNFSPDGAFILYLVSEKSSLYASRLMRVPVWRRPSRIGIERGEIKNFSCAREANLCVVVEEVEGKQILTTFDPLKGRGEKLPTSDYPQFERGILSAQGRIVEKLRAGPDGLSVHVHSLPKGPAEEITFKNLIDEYEFYGWSLDGKGNLPIHGWGSGRQSSIFAGLNGETHILWQRRPGPGFDFGLPIPSPDGRYSAVKVIIFESNAWMLENF